MSTTASPSTKVARDLTEIVRLYADLLAQAIHKAAARIDGTSLPGGDAMVALAGVADRAINERRVELREEQHLAACQRLDHTRCWTGSEDEDGAEPVLQTLLFWSELWREQHGFPLEGRRPTVATEANVIRSLIDWAWENLAEWDDFVKDVRDARVRLENLLYAGRRQETTRVVCPDCIEPPRLIHIYGPAEDGSSDLWKCPRCRLHLDAEGVHRAHGKMLRSEGADRWVHQADAVSTLKTQGRNESLVRRWLRDLAAEAYCDPKTRAVYVWWPSLWRKHLMTPTRRRVAGIEVDPVA